MFLLIHVKYFKTLKVLVLYSLVFALTRYLKELPRKVRFWLRMHDENLSKSHNNTFRPANIPRLTDWWLTNIQSTFVKQTLRYVLSFRTECELSLMEVENSYYIKWKTFCDFWCFTLATAPGHTDSSLISLATDPGVCQRVRGYAYNHQTMDLLLGSQHVTTV